MAENVLLRKPLIMLLRKVKQPAYPKPDMMFLFLIVKTAQTWKHIMYIVKEEDAKGVASSENGFRFSAAVAVQT